MDASRRQCLLRLAVVPLALAAMVRAAGAQGRPKRIIEARIENRKVVEPKGAIRINEGERIELVWTSDEPVELHLHGYDLKVRVRPGTPAVMAVEANATGRFPISSHGWGEGSHGHSHGHDALTHLEVYPR